MHTDKAFKFFPEKNAIYEPINQDLMYKTPNNRLYPNKSSNYTELFSPQIDFYAFSQPDKR